MRSPSILKFVIFAGILQHVATEFSARWFSFLFFLIIIFIFKLGSWGLFLSQYYLVVSQ